MNTMDTMNTTETINKSRSEKAPKRAQRRKWKAAQFALMLSLLLSLPVLAGCQNGANDAENKTNVSQACSEEETACLPDEGKQEQGALPGENFREISFDEAVALFRDGKDGIVYFGFADCPWCQELVPVLDEELGEKKQTAYFVRTRDADHNRLYTDEQRDEIRPYIEAWMKENDEGEMTLYVPLVVRIEEGRAAAGHQGTVEGHNAKERSMTDEEVEKLREELAALIES